MREKKKVLRINKEDAILAVIDFQEKLVPAMENKEKLIDKAKRLIEGVRTCNVPVAVTQQYTLGLGKTVEPLISALGEDYLPIDKLHFSAYNCEDFKEILQYREKNTVILCGIEAHICVLQTALDLLENGYDVFLVEDACASRKNEDFTWGINRVAEAGGMITTVEAVLMELIGGAKDSNFKAISKIIK